MIPRRNLADCSARDLDMVKDWNRKVSEVSSQSSSSSVRTETVFGPPDLLALNHHVANGATDNKDGNGGGNGNTGSRVHGYSNHRRNALVLRKW